MVGDRIPLLFFRQTGIQMMVAEGLLTRPVPDSLDGRPAREIMEHLARQYGARWVDEGGIYVLAASERLARYLVLEQRERDSIAGSLVEDLVETLSLGQRQTLLRKGELALSRDRARKRQREILLELGALAVAHHSLSADPGCLEGNGITLRAGRGADGGGVEVWVASRPSGARLLVRRHLPAR
jgi:hypothetical protein